MYGLVTRIGDGTGRVGKLEGDGGLSGKVYHPGVISAVHTGDDVLEGGGGDHPAGDSIEDVR